MTNQQHSELEQAITRAQRDGIVILARGTRKSDGARVWGVTSKSTHDYRLHQVVEVGGRLICDCPSRVICKHRGLVHQALVAEVAAARAPTQTRPADAGDELLRSVMDPQDYADLKARAAAPTRESPALATDTRAVGIWK